VEEAETIKLGKMGMTTEVVNGVGGHHWPDGCHETQVYRKLF